MNSHIFKNILLLSFFILAIVFSYSYVNAEVQTYATYEKNLQNNCTNPELKWNNADIGSINIPAPKYSELTKSAITETKANLKANANDAENRAWIE
jgi:regulatory protein YycI of two-component signal transduction system YycFG